MRQLGRIIREIATEHCDGRALFVLEGDYDPALLATCVVETFLGFEEGQDVDRIGLAAIPARQRAILLAVLVDNRLSNVRRTTTPNRYRVGCEISR